MRTGTSLLVKAGELSTRVITAKTVNEELHALKASCERIKRKLERAPSAKLADLLSKQETKLALCIMAAQDGRTYRHRVYATRKGV